MPVIPLLDVVGKGCNVAPEQIAGTAVNVGAVFSALTVIVRVVVLAHCAAFGVKVYVVVAVLLMAGDQIPVIPFVEVVGKGAIAVPVQTGGTALKVGVAIGLTLIVRLPLTAHCPLLGVKV